MLGWRSRRFALASDRFSKNQFRLNRLFDRIERGFPIAARIVAFLRLPGGAAGCGSRSVFC
jgi:hypothetical protein